MSRRLTWKAKFESAVGYQTDDRPEIDWEVAYEVFDYRMALEDLLLQDDPALVLLGVSLGARSDRCRGEDPLHRAVERGNTKAVRALLGSTGVNPSANCSYVLTRACEEGMVDIVRELLRDGRADPAACDSSCLVNAIKEHRTEVVGMLVNDGRCDVNVETGLPLMLAVLTGIPEMVASLLSCSEINPSLRGDIALKTAVACGERAMVRMLYRACSGRSHE